MRSKAIVVLAFSFLISTTLFAGGAPTDCIGALGRNERTAEADKSITKTDGVTSAVPGQDTITYTILAGNSGPCSDSNVSVTDTFPEPLSCSWTSVAQGGATGNSSSSGNLNDTTLNMPAGSSVRYTVTCSIDPNATGTLSNTVNISGGSVFDPFLENNNATDNNTTLNPEANLSVTKTVDPNNVSAGEEVTYTMIVSNAGPSHATDVMVEDVLPEGLGLVSATSSQGSCSETDGTVTCDLGTIDVDGSATVTLVVQTLDSGEFENTVTVTTSALDSNGAAGTAPVVSAAKIPALDQWALLMLALILAMAGLVAVRR